ncbi:hypothetical protein N8B89_11650 [Enterococcus faecium]
MKNGKREGFFGLKKKIKCLWGCAKKKKAITKKIAPPGGGEKYFFQQKKKKIKNVRYVFFIELLSICFFFFLLRIPETLDELWKSFKPFVGRTPRNDLFFLKRKTQKERKGPGVFCGGECVFFVWEKGGGGFFFLNFDSFLTKSRFSYLCFHDSGKVQVENQVFIIRSMNVSDRFSS